MTGAPTTTAPWDPSVDDRFVVRAVRPVAPEVCTVVLAPLGPGALRFDAGQYVTVQFDLHDGAVRRCYTIASPPTRPDRLAITVKRTPGGAVSPWLHDGGLAPGAVVRVGAPQGDFTMQAHPAGRHLLLTAGSGITPALSMLRRLYDLAEEADVVVLHAQGTPEEVPYRRELETIADLLPTVRLHLLCTRLARDGAPDDGAAGRRVVPGRLTAELLTRLVPDAADREVLICGPTAFRTAAQQACAAVGCPPGQVHQELFTLGAAPRAALPAAPESAPPPTAEGFRVEFRDAGTSVVCAPGTTLLAAAATAGISWASSCAQGLCGTCKATLVAGEVDMQHAGGIRPREIASGKILLCCSRPTTDVVVAS